MARVCFQDDRSPARTRIGLSTRSPAPVAAAWLRGWVASEKSCNLLISKGDDCSVLFAYSSSVAKLKHTPDQQQPWGGLPGACLLGQVGSNLQRGRHLGTSDHMLQHRPR